MTLPATLIQKSEAEGFHDVDALKRRHVVLQEIP